MIATPVRNPGLMHTDRTDYLSVLGLYFLVYSLASRYVSGPWSWSSFLKCFRCEVWDFAVFNAGRLMPWEPHGGEAKP